MHKRSTRAIKRAERRQNRRQEAAAVRVIRRKLRVGMVQGTDGYAVLTFAPAELLRRHNRR